MSYLLSGLDLVVNNTTSIIVNTNPITIQGDIAASENVIAVNNRYNRFFAPDNTPVAVINSTSKATSLINLTAKAVGTTQVPIAATYTNDLGNNLNINYDGEHYVKLLLFNTNASTILDGSNNNYTIVNTSDSVWPGASGPQTGPFAGSNSWFFNALDSDFLRINNPISSLLGAEDFTIEFFIRGSTDWSTLPVIIDTGSNLGFQYWQVSITATGQVQFTYTYGTSTTVNVVTTSTIGISSWWHVAIVRNNTVQRPGNNFNIYINGVSGVSALIANNWGDTGTNANSVVIGKSPNNTRYLPANLSNLRITQSAVYTGNFTSPTSNLQVAQAASTNIAAIPLGRKINTKYSTTSVKSATYNPTQIPLYNSLKYSSPTGQKEVYDPDLVGNSRINSYIVSNLSNKSIVSGTQTFNVDLSPEFYVNGPDAPIVLSTEGRGEITTQITGALVFNGNLDKLTYEGDPENINISADFTLEFWLKPNNWNQSVIQTVMSNRTEQSLGWCIFKNSDSTDCLRLTFRSTSGTLVSSDVTNNVWQHWALVRSGSTLTWWKNGKIDTSTTSPPGSLLGGTPFSLGTGKTGGSLSERNSAAFEISNLRIVKGTALYASTFTPQVPLSVVANTTFLLPVANSATQLLDTVSGSTLTSNSVEFTNLGPVINTSTTTLITPVRGGGSFNGTTATLTSPGNSLFNLTTNDFTLEAWVYFQGTTAACTIMGQQGGPSPNRGWLWTMGTGGDMNIAWSLAGNGAISSGGNYNSTALVPLNQWAHIAFVRKATTYTFYINGVAAGSGTMSGQVNFVGSFGIGYTPNETTSGQSYFKGSISNIRIVNGVAVYTGNFTVPAKPLAKEQNAGTNIEAITTQTVLLTLQNPLTLVDNSNSANTISNVGGVTIASTYSPVWASYATPLSTGGFKFSGGASEYYTLPALNTVFEFGTGDFTIELWVYITKSQTGYIYDTRPTTTQGAYATLYYSSAAGWISYDTDASSRLTAPVSLNTWYHVAVCRISGITKMYLNGTQSGSGYISSNSYSTSSSPTNLGASTYTTGAAPFAGQISNLRVVKGLGVYTGNFTVPTSPLTKTQASSTNISAIVGGFTSLLTAQDGTKLDYSDNATTISSSVNSVTPSVLYGPVLGTVSTAATVNSSPGAYVSTPSINATNIEYIDYRTDPRSVNKRVKNLIVGTTGVLEELQSWS
jgi:hypothetical protein